MAPFSLPVFHLIAFTVQQNREFPGLGAHRLEREDLRGAVVGEGVVPAWMVVQIVGQPDVVEEESAREGDGRGGVVR